MMWESLSRLEARDAHRNHKFEYDNQHLRSNEKPWPGFEAQAQSERANETNTFAGVGAQAQSERANET